MNDARFIVFDVETPNRYNDRISSIGITVVENGAVTDSFFSYVNPQTFFDPFNTKLTGISESTVATAPSFPELWRMIEPIMSGGILVAHNALFDLSVLKKCLDDYGIKWKKEAEYCCTVQMGRKLLPGMRHGLNTMCDYYGIELDHHQADSDSMAAAMILLRYMKGGAQTERFVRKFQFCRTGRKSNVAGSDRETVNVRHTETRIEDFDLETWLKNTNDVTILISASYDKTSDTGIYRGLLCYKHHRKAISGTVEKALSPNHTMIIGLFDGIGRVRLREVNIRVISGIRIGFKYAKKGKGLYANELNELLAVAQKQGNTVGSIAITNGSAQIIIGTHSCVGKDVVYKDLALAVVDEEHRFGVKQRTAIVEKAAKGVHSITMSATPIPRSLAQVIYGDNIQLHIVRSMPNGRKAVKTRVFRNQTGNMKFVLKEVQAGHQAYVVCPMIENNEKVPGVKSVDQITKEYREFLEPQGVRIGSLTGKTSKEETSEIINSFKDGKIDVLIATTVIEVGVNVPNATVMIITNAERFGLSSLHQLRGRVGRGDLQSYCVLQSDDESPKGLARLQVLCDTTDGFQIAEADLAQRGAGDLLGTQQSGENKYVALMIANPNRYQYAIQVAKELILRGNDCCPMMDRITAERSSER